MAQEHQGQNGIVPGFSGIDQTGISVENDITIGNIGGGSESDHAISELHDPRTSLSALISVDVFLCIMVIVMIMVMKLLIVMA